MKKEAQRYPRYRVHHNCHYCDTLSIIKTKCVGCGPQNKGKKRPSKRIKRKSKKKKEKKEKKKTGKEIKKIKIIIIKIKK